jgi:hypothetical protein
MNATEMARPFEGKSVSNFLRGKDLLAYINALHESKFIPQIRRINESPLISTEARKLCTWFHENLALRFAQWLNPKFSVWCDERIKEIFNRGFTALTPDPEGRDVIDRWAGFESRKQRSDYQMLITSYLLIWKDSTFQSKQKMGLFITNVIAPLRKVRQSDT